MNVIQRIFEAVYGVASLGRVDENFLPAVLFADVKGGKKIGLRGLFTWLEYGDSANHIPKGTFGNCSEGGRLGIWYDGEDYKRYKLGDSQCEVISHEEAVGYAVALRNVIDEIDYILSAANLNLIGDYLNLDSQIKKVCAKWLGIPYWSDDGELCVYLLKYFHILYPSKLCSIYSDADLDAELVRLKISLPDGTSRLVKNGVILLAKRGVSGRVSHKEVPMEMGGVGELSAEVGDGGANYPKPVLKVTTDYSGVVYLREKSYGDFCGTGWGEANPYTGADPQNVFFFTYDSIQANIRRIYSSRNDITVQLESGIDRYYYPYAAQQTVVDLNDVVIAGNIGDGKSYTIEFYPEGAYYYRWDWNYGVNQDAYDNLQCDFRYLSSSFYNQNSGSFTTDEAIESEIQSGRLNVGEWGFSQYDFNRVVKGVCDYFRENYTYSYDFDFSGSNGDNVAYFLSGGTGRKGVCRHFASAAVLILRHLYIPARYVTGYCCSVKKGETTQVTTENAHAWVEVYNPYVGWLIADPTPPVPDAGDGEEYLNEESYTDSWLADNFENLLYRDLLEAIRKYYKPDRARY